MNEMELYQPKLPANIQRQLSKQNNQMEYIAKLAMDALGKHSDLYIHAVFQVINTMETVARLKAAYSENGISPESEAMLKRLTINYLNSMEQIPKDVWNHIYRTLQDLDPLPENESIFGLLRSTLSRLLKGKG